MTKSFSSSLGEKIYVNSYIDSNNLGADYENRSTEFIEQNWETDPWYVNLVYNKDENSDRLLETCTFNSVLE